jgi:alpha-N-arabinofuranosidase
MVRHPRFAAGSGSRYNDRRLKRRKERQDEPGKNGEPFAVVASRLGVRGGAPAQRAATEYHVAVGGKDANPGTKAAPLRTIQHAADLAQPGDVVTVHEGVYREQVAPPRGGSSGAKRIVYQAAPGERVVIAGSEPAKGWQKVVRDTWKLTLSNKFFGKFNPYDDLIRGDWFKPLGRQHHTGTVYLNGEWVIEAARFDDVMQPCGAAPMWFAEVGKSETSIWAQFPGVDPNDAKAGSVEINVRKTVFTPEKTGVNYITLRGFMLRNAATNWAPPSAAQTGLVTAYWCKGWVIENNDIGYSRCAGVALGKYGDEFDNTNAAGRAEPFTECVRRALKNGWDPATVGSHVVRNNHIHHCEQAGLVGSMGCAFSIIAGNEIHDIHVQGLFSGAEMAGIKFHGATDALISGNHVYRCGDVAGIWLDWMAQGARVTRNLLHDNTGDYGDLFLEMQHGPIVVDNNLLLSRRGAIGLNAQGVAFVHNLFAGPIRNLRSDARSTPFQLPHSTKIAGIYASAEGDSGDDRFYNNLFAAPCSLRAIDNSVLPCFASGNVFTKGTQPSRFDVLSIIQSDFDPVVKLVDRAGQWYLVIDLGKTWTDPTHSLVTTKVLGKAKISAAAFENPNGSWLRIDTDYFGRKRYEANPFPGPFELPGGGRHIVKVWSG